MSGLTPAEQTFFETGELQPGMVAAPAAAPVAAPVDPLANAGLSVAPAPVAPVVAAPVAPVVATPAPPALDNNADFLTQRLADSQRRIGELEQLARQTAAQQQQVVEPPAPDPGTDPIGAMMHQLGGLQKQMLTMQQNLVQTQQQAQQLTQLQNFQNQVTQLQNDFTQTTPDYNAALLHMRSTRIADLRAFGATDQQIAGQLMREEFSIAEAAVNNGKNPASVIYEMSKRHGYVPTKNPAGATVVAATPVASAASIEAIQRAQAAGQSLTAAPVQDSELTVEGLRAATDADLNKLVLNSASWEKLTGADKYPL